MSSPGWPALPLEGWQGTKGTLHRYCQIVGKVRMALVPFRDHWWHVTLYLHPRGLSTGAMPYGDGYVEVILDLQDHRLAIDRSGGRRAGFPLTHRPACADFCADFFAAMRDVGVEVDGG